MHGKERRNNPMRGLDLINGTPRTLDRSTGANDVLSRKQWGEDIRNSMYQLSTNELVDFLLANPVERERLRVAIETAEERESQT